MHIRVDVGKGWGGGGFCCCCLTSHLHASVVYLLSHLSMCKTEIETADQNGYLIHSQYTGIRPTSLSTDPTTPDTWQGSCYRISFKSLALLKQGKWGRGGEGGWGGGRGRGGWSRMSATLKADTLPRQTVHWIITGKHLMYYANHTFLHLTSAAIII